MSFEINNYQVFLNAVPLFSAINCRIQNKETLAILGPSGSGKSTILADISGVLTPSFVSEGQLTLNGEDLRKKPIEQRNVGILFQDDLLFPHLNVFENLVFGLPKKMSKTEKRQKISHALNESGLGEFADRDIATLSGGQRSRISLLRTLLSSPDLILLDEPFSKLDKTLRGVFREWVFQQIRELNIPAVLVTHDEDDIPDGSHIIQLEASYA